MVIDNSHENTLWQAPAGLLRQKRKTGVGEIDLSEFSNLGLCGFWMETQLWSVQMILFLHSRRVLSGTKAYNLEKIGRSRYAIEAQNL